MKLDLRVFVQCHGDEEARDILDALCERLADFKPRSEQVPVRYWKIPALFEFSLDLGEASAESFARLLGLEPAGWHHGGELPDLWSVWNWQEGAMWLHPGARWAEVQFTSRTSG